VSRLTSNEHIARLRSGGLASNVLSLIAVVFFAVAMMIYDLQLAVIGIGLSLLNVVALKMVWRQRENLSRGLAIERGKLNGNVIGLIRTIETTKAGGLEGGAFSRWAGFHAKVLNTEHELSRYAVFLDLCPSLLTALSTAAVLCIGGLRVMDGAMTLGTLIAFQSLLASFDGPISSLVQLTGTMHTVKGELFRLEDVFNYPADKSQDRTTVPPGMLAKLSGRLELRNVTFGYSPLDPPLIEGFSLKLEPGMRIALVGETGSGKTTIGRLICGLARPWSGEIVVDGWTLADIPRDVFANSVGYVDQDIILFEGTMLENLTLWDASVPEAEIWTALGDAMLDQEVSSRPKGLHCHVQEAGINFSAGQQQRIEIARALVGRPSLLVLDEATSALDPVTEECIDANLRRRGCTCVIIAHRLSTIRDCDEIIVLHEGQVVERGTHDALMARGGAYAKLVKES
jgi:ABC-type bacteriocin/lantibiotic exporter with double-glycine peptidase domain